MTSASVPRTVATAMGTTWFDDEALLVLSEVLVDEAMSRLVEVETDDVTDDVMEVADWDVEETGSGGGGGLAGTV